MKFNLKSGSIIAALMLFASSAFAGTHAKSNTIVDVASSTEGFTTLVAALKAADLVDTLSGQGPFTVFAPTDEAFAALPEGALEGLLADPQQLASVLTLHVVAGKAEAADVVGLSDVTTVQGKSLSIDTSDGVSVGGAKVIQADVGASNGVIHVIDRVILP
ncbi:MAG: fasciclin domain-containing protein [Pseudomonadota bacterium]